MAHLPVAFALSLGSGMTIAGQRWAARLPSSSSSSKGLVVALHGWLDNSSSFTRIAALLSLRGYDVAAIDLPGHGCSSHLPREGGSSSPYQFPQNITVLKQFVDLYTSQDCSSASEVAMQQQLQPVYILGHSMGAGISLMAAGAFPSMCRGVILLDGFGPYAREEALSCDSFRKAAAAEIKGWADPAGGKGYGARKHYSSLEAAVEARLRAVATYPGNQSLSYDAALLLVTRGTERGAAGEGVFFRHDSRLASPSYNYYTNKQVDSFVKCIEAPVLLLTAERGWPPVVRDDFERRADLLRSKGLFTHFSLHGSHHFHLDDDSCGPVADHVISFLDSDCRV